MKEKYIMNKASDKICKLTNKHLTHQKKGVKRHYRLSYVYMHIYSSGNQVRPNNRNNGPCHCPSMICQAYIQMRHRARHDPIGLAGP